VQQVSIAVTVIKHNWKTIVSIVHRGHRRGKANRRGKQHVVVTVSIVAKSTV